MTDNERIEKLEKENEIMKKILIILISNGKLENLDLLRELLGQLIL